MYVCMYLFIYLFKMLYVLRLIHVYNGMVWLYGLYRMSIPGGGGDDCTRTIGQLGRHNTVNNSEVLGHLELGRYSHRLPNS